MYSGVSKTGKTSMKPNESYSSSFMSLLNNVKQLPKKNVLMISTSNCGLSGWCPSLFSLTESPNTKAVLFQASNSVRLPGSGIEGPFPMDQIQCQCQWQLPVYANIWITFLDVHEIKDIEGLGRSFECRIRTDSDCWH